MYNTQFKVKYNDTEEELVHKLKVKTSEEYKENPDEEHEYSTEDVSDICNKLYRDELLSVFGAEELHHEKIVKGMNYVYDIMMPNEKFKEIITGIVKVTFNEFITNENEEIIKEVILISLFSQQLFYITHKCICQQIELGIIDDELLDELRKHSFIDLFKD